MHGGRWQALGNRDRGTQLESFPGEEEERAILTVVVRKPDRAADAAAVLVAVERGLIGQLHQGVLGGRKTVAVVPEERPMKLIGPALGDHHHLRAALAELGGAVAADYLEFLDGLKRRPVSQASD